MIIYGKQVSLYALEHKEKDIKTVYVAKKNILPQALFHKYHDKIKFLEEKWAQSMAKGGNHQGILVEMEAYQETSFSEIKQHDFIVVLDGLTDVGNIGAIVRSAYALGAGAMIISGLKQINYAAIARTSSGALFDMPVMLSKNVLDNFNELSQLGYEVYGAEMEGKAVESVSFSTKRILVLGNEGKGLSKKVSFKVNHPISIGMKNAFDSLNVSAAAAILIHRMGL